MTVKISLRTLTFSSIIILSFFQNWFVENIPVFGYFDEVFALIMLCYALNSKSFWNTHKGKYPVMIFISLILILWGVFCNLYAEVQTAFFPIVEDIMSIFKFLYVYIGIITFLRTKGVDTKAVLKCVLPVVKGYALILAILALANLFIDIGMHTEVRYGFRSFAFTYGVSGHIINQATYLLLLLSAENELLGKKNTFWKVIAILLMVCTLKSRAFVLVAVYCALYYFFVLRKKKRLGLELGIVGVLVLLVGFSQFEYYFLTEGSPRQRLVAGALDLVKQYFPFGTGFGTYGSSAAAKHYSPLYYALGFNNRYGMTPDAPLFLNDNYLPMIFAQFGLIMAVVFLCLLYMYSRAILTDEKRVGSQRTRMIAWFFLANVLLSSIQSSFLASYTIVDFSVMFFVFFYPNRRERTER